MVQNNPELVPIDPIDPKDMQLEKLPQNATTGGSTQLVERERSHIDPYRSAIADAATHNYEVPPDFVVSTAASLMMDRWADAHSMLIVRSPGSAIGITADRAHSAASTIIAFSLESVLLGVAFSPLITAYPALWGVTTFGSTIMARLLGQAKTPLMRAIWAGYIFAISASGGYFFARLPKVESFVQERLVTSAQVAPQLYEQLKRREADRNTYTANNTRADQELQNSRTTDAQAGSGARNTTFDRTRIIRENTHRENDPKIAEANRDIAGTQVEIDRAMMADPSLQIARNVINAFYTLILLAGAYFLGEQIRQTDPQHRASKEEKRALKKIRIQRDTLAFADEARKNFAANILGRLKAIYRNKIIEDLTGSGTDIVDAKKYASEKADQTFADMGSLSLAAAESFNKTLTQSGLLNEVPRPSASTRMRMVSLYRHDRT